MMNQNFAVHVYYWFLIDRYINYSRVASDMCNILDTQVNDFQAFKSNTGMVLCKIRIDNRIITLSASIDSLYINNRVTPTIRLSMFQSGLMLDMDVDADVEGLKRRIERWKIDHANEYNKYWRFNNPWGVEELTVRRYIHIKELNGKPIYEGIKHIDTAFNELVKTYTDLALSGGNDNDE